MRTHNFSLKSGLLVAVLGASLAAACGDDETGGGEGNEGGASDGSGATGATGGSESSGGASAGADAGGSDTGGTSVAGGDTGGTSVGGAAGGAGPASGGSTGEGGGGDDAGGAGGEGGAEPALATISEVSDHVYTNASDLRGLFFATSGKLYASGFVNGAANQDKKTVVARFNQDGTPDATFGTGGFLTLNLVERVVTTVPTTGGSGGGGAGGTDVGGTAGGGAAGGGAAGSAGAGGGASSEVVVNDGSEESLGIVELSNGNLVVQLNLRDAAGKGTDVALLALTPAGARVAGFGTDGLKRIDFGWTPANDASWVPTTGAPADQSWGIELDNSGAAQKIVVFGFGPAAFGSTTGTPAVQRTDNDRYITRVLAADGAIDPAFNAGKAFTFNSGGTFSDGGRRGIVEADGSIVSAGYTNFGSGLGNYILAIRLTPAGVLDTSFGFGIANKGVVRVNPFVDDGGVAECYNITRQKSGRYVTTGYGSATGTNLLSSYPGYVTTTGPDLISVAFTANGQDVDESFGVFGTRVIQSEEVPGIASTEDRGRDVLALGDDRLVYAGRFGTDPAIFVVDSDGGYDPDNGVGQLFRYTPLTNGVPPATGTPTTSHFFRVAKSRDGKRIAATTSNNADGVLLAVLKVGE